MKRDYQLKISEEIYRDNYIKSYLKHYANKLIDAYIETRLYEDSKYKYTFDMSVHFMFTYIPHKELKDELILFTKLYNISYKACMQLMTVHAFERLSFFNKLIFIFNGNWVGCNYSPKHPEEIS